MPSEGLRYPGDELLNKLLKSAGSRYDSSGVRDLLAGVLSAPPGESALGWADLVAPEPSSELRQVLGALHNELLQARSGPAPAASAARLTALRDELAKRGLTGFAIPHSDEHQGEYLPARAERLAWLTGFDGSAGAALVLGKRAAIFVDGRYTLQVRAQVDTAVYEPRHLIDEPLSDWLATHLRPKDRFGFDPWLHTKAQEAALRAVVEGAGAKLLLCDSNPIDAIWADQPPAPIAPVRPHGAEFAGQGAAEKRGELAESLAKKDLAAVVLTQPDSIAWLLNLRGGDVPCNPLPLSFAIQRADSTVLWFVDDRKLAPEVSAHLGNGVSIRPPESLGSALDALGEAGQRVQVDPASAAAWIFHRLTAAGATPVEGSDPCQLPKAIKNAVELEGTRRAHRRDGASLTRFLAWLAAEAPARAESGNSLGELEASDHLRALRRENDEFRGLSFDTISGAGANGAIVHYRATPETERKLGLGELFLLDSGAQYPDGTTDVTRTIAVGTPSAEMRDRFTRVLKGHIALATARFPEGTTGSQLDTLARAPLWQAGLDFDHGTGHGVGSYLSVHEGPQRISKAPNRVSLVPGMIVSNEPGYYKTGAYGIRIENLVTVTESPPQAGDERSMLALETLTLAPIDRALVEPDLLRADEVAWLDAYHARVRETLTPLVDQATAKWLAEVTRPLARISHTPRGLRGAVEPTG